MIYKGDVKIFAIIVTYNGVHWVEKCLNSLVKSSIPINIVVVDNRSTDNTVALIRHSYPKVILIESSENVGFGRANNMGIIYALHSGADYVFLLNQDAWIKQNTIEGLINIQKRNKDYGIVSPIHLNGKGTAMDYNFSQLCDVLSCPGFLSDLYVGNLNSIYPINFVMAAIWLIPKETLLKVGLFDPIFPHYGEDVDYVQRAKNFHLKIGICPEFIGFHDREERVPSDKRDEVIRHLNYICLLKNNNKSFVLAIFQFSIQWVRHIIVFLLKKKWKLFFNEIMAGTRIFFMLLKIKQNRAYTKKEAAFLMH